MSFFIFDMSLLVIFILLTSILLYRGRKNLVREGPLILYKTKWGIKLINYVGGKYKKTLKFLSYISIGVGYLLMVSIVALIIQTLYLYLTTPIASIIKAPPIMPLIPYFPKLFGLESYFPSFPVVSFIISLLIVATVHEFAHGIFARRYGIKIKSTGFAFFKYFPALFGAFVEQDDNQMKRKTKFEQMSVLSAGVFANVITAFVFFLIFVTFFFYAFVPAGIMFDSYSYSIMPSKNITSINGIQLDNPTIEEMSIILNGSRMGNITANNENYVGVFGEIKKIEMVALYNDAPAINANLPPIIQEINGVKITSLEILESELEKYSPGEKVTLITIDESNSNEVEIILTENPNKKGAAWLGIGFLTRSNKGVVKKLYSWISSFKEQHIYYKSKNGDINQFIYDLLWWIILINFAVALFNMLPAWIFDGGMFWYLTIWGITKSEKSARKFFSLMNWFILLIFIALMVKWVSNFFI